MQDKVKIKYRVGLISIFSLICLALLFDLALIPILQNIAAGIYWIIAGTWLWMRDVSSFKMRQFIPEISSFLIEQIPALQTFPFLTLGIAIVIILTRLEDKTGISIGSLKDLKNIKNIEGVLQNLNRVPGVTLPRNQRQPLNKTPGVRPPRQKGRVMVLKTKILLLLLDFIYLKYIL